MIKIGVAADIIIFAFTVSVLINEIRHALYF